MSYAGEKVYEIYDSLTAATEQKGEDDEYDTVKVFLTTYFTPKTNVAYESLRFRHASQCEGEAIDMF